jgi:hypothetical protein
LDWVIAARQIPPPEDKRAPSRADATIVTSRRSTPRPTKNHAPRACALAAALLAAAVLPASAAAAPGSGTGALVWVLAAIGAAVLAFTLLRLRRGRGGSRISISDIADGRQLLIARGRRVTEELTELTDVVADREDEGATRRHQRALDIVAEVRSRIGRSSGQRVQAKAHQDLDEAEWLIGGLRARLDGFVEPLQYRNGLPATCFFDGRHGLATVELDLGGIALQRIPVRACAACAVGLVRGERPRVGSVELGGRALPWPAAPRWCGSYGWALKDLKHLHYDGDPLFSEPERLNGRRRQTVAERARGVRARVLPVAPEVLSEDPADELPDDYGVFAGSDAEAAHEQSETDAPPSSAAFAAMESEATASAESPVAARDAQAD